jgi:hypothetical protein
MNLIDHINYGVVIATQTTNKIAANPFAVKKVVSIVIKIFEAVDVRNGQGGQQRLITDAMKGTIDQIEFYGTFKNIIFWINPFTKATIDQQALQTSLELLLSNEFEEKNVGKSARLVFEGVMAQESYYSKDEVRERIKLSLNEKIKMDSEKVEKIVNQVIIKQQSRPIIQILTMASFTVAESLSNLMTLKRWGILDLSQIAAQIGGQSKVFLFVVNLGAATVLRGFVIAGQTLSVGQASYRIITNRMEYYRLKKVDQSDLEEKSESIEEKKEKSYKELRNSVLDLLSSGTELTAIVIPLVFAVNPPVLIALAIVTKSTGLFCILAR